jgi:hypothetical protein
MQTAGEAHDNLWAVRDGALMSLLRAQAGAGPHAELARQMVLALLFAQLLAGSGHDGPPHASQRAPRQQAPRRNRLVHRGSLSGRRARG